MSLLRFNEDRADEMYKGTDPSRVSLYSPQVWASVLNHVQEKKTKTKKFDYITICPSQAYQIRSLTTFLKYVYDVNIQIFVNLTTTTTANFACEAV